MNTPYSVQDRNERGLELLRSQYAAVGITDDDLTSLGLGWTYEGDTTVIEFNGQRFVCQGHHGNLATLLCRAVRLGWFMMNDLESIEANEKLRGSADAR